MMHKYREELVVYLNREFLSSEYTANLTAWTIAYRKGYRDPNYTVPALIPK